MMKKFKAFVKTYFETFDSEDLVVLYKSLILVVVLLLGMVLFVASIA
jgi:hypothetical protein